MRQSQQELRAVVPQCRMGLSKHTMLGLLVLTRNYILVGCFMCCDFRVYECSFSEVLKGVANDTSMLCSSSTSMCHCRYLIENI